MKKREVNSLKLNKKRISNLEVLNGGANGHQQNGNGRNESIKTSMEVSCYMSCVDYTKYKTCSIQA